MTALTAARVAELFNDCEGGTTPVEGLRLDHFHDDRVAEHRNEIAAMLNELPDDFHAAGGGGWSFLNACTDRNGRQWCDTHATVGMLLALGIAAGMVTFALPRPMWHVLPGGMPYLIINTDAPQDDLDLTDQTENR
ncbi:hypothetical protein DVS28_b0374 (plasmid) [Euzebya pacifica]|uniref:Uncharacterized protein n=1 Tax=Euzebya pacifica TaxID=1608957 RepID=A0A346Y6P7_9ACTN|nr:hypothetical protein [Euzebya pacifica]AXV10144.1 hypothetical protein DVS28_b0374 [Euzebya pacifica]